MKVENDGDRATEHGESADLEQLRAADTDREENQGDERPQPGHCDVPPVEGGLDVHPVEELEQRERRGVDREDTGECQRAEGEDRTLSVEVLDESSDERRHRVEAAWRRPRAGEPPVDRGSGRDGEQRGHAGQVVAEPREEQIGLGLEHERVRSREDEVGEREQLEARIRKAPTEPREHGGFGCPRDDECRPVEELCECDGSQRGAGGDGERRQLGLAPPGGNCDGAVDHGRGGEGDSARVALEEDETGEQGQGHVAAGVQRWRWRRAAVPPYAAASRSRCRGTADRRRPRRPGRGLVPARPPGTRASGAAAR